MWIVLVIMLVLALSSQAIEAALEAGQLACPACAGRLSPCGYARSREVRLHDQTRTLTPRRASCPACERTHVLCPAWTVPRRRDGAEVIGAAIALAADRVGHRRIASKLGRPEGTVRGWLRAARARAQLLRAVATRQLVALDPEPGAVTPASCAFGDAVEAIMLAVRAWRLRFGPDRAGPWERAVCLTDGLLLPGSARLARWPAPG